MMLGKRQRPPIKRTTSMTEFLLDLSTTTTTPHVQAGDVAYNNSSQPFDPRNPFPSGPHKPAANAAAVAGGVASSRAGRRHSADFLETTDHFLTACSLCKRRLIPGRDIYMYRGDSAFCSLECRQQKMNQDERKEKCSLLSKMEALNTATGSEVSTTGETVAAL